MTKPNLTEVVAVIDESGSMWSLRDDVIGGFNSFIKDQVKVEGELRLTLVKFGTDVYPIYDNHPASEDKLEDFLLDEEKYCPGGSTALYDAVGTAVDRVGKRLAEMSEDKRPENVIVLIITDGYENCSTEYTQQAVLDKVEHQKEKYGWEFLFQAADIDAVEVGTSIGVGQDRIGTYQSTSIGTRSAYSKFNKAVKGMRVSGEIDASWKDEDDDE